MELTAHNSSVVGSNPTELIFLIKMTNILYLVLCTPLVGGFIVLFLPKNDFYLIRDVSFTASLLTLV